MQQLNYMKDSQVLSASYEIEPSPVMANNLFKVSVNSHSRNYGAEHGSQTLES